MNSLVKHMVDRFLGWKLPESFAPDAGISLDREYVTKWGMPTGTNLFTATEAHAMVGYMLAGAPIDDELETSKALLAAETELARGQVHLAIIKGRNDGIELVAQMLESKAEAFALEHGYSDLGALSFGRGAQAEAKSDYHQSLVELAEEVRALASAPTPPAAPSQADRLENPSFQPEHELKCWPGPFSEILAGLKTAEFRKDDRGFRPGDWILLREWLPDAQVYTSRSVLRYITAKTTGFGIPDGYAMLSLSKRAQNGEGGQG